MGSNALGGYRSWWRRRRLTRDAGRRVELELVEALVGQKLGDDRIESAPVLAQQAAGFCITFVGDAMYLLIQGIKHGVRSSGHPWVTVRWQH